MSVIVNINIDGRTADSFPIHTPRGKVEEIRQPAGNVSIELIDDTGFAPQNIQALRIANDLYLTIKDDTQSNQPDLIIKDYYLVEDQAPIIGMASNGEMYAYIANSGINNELIPNLQENVSAEEVLGGTGLSNSVNESSNFLSSNGLWFLGSGLAFLATDLLVNKHSDSPAAEKMEMNKSPSETAIHEIGKESSPSTLVDNNEAHKGANDILLKGGEEITLNLHDLLSSSRNTPIKLNLASDYSAQPIKIDLGNHSDSLDLSDNSVKSQEGEWLKQEATVELDHISYNVYHHSAMGNNDNYDIWIQANTNISVF